MRRRDFIKAIAGSSVAWPLVTEAQQSQKMRRLSVLMSTAADDQESMARYTAFLQGLQELGWTDGRNVRIDVRWGAGDAERTRKYAAELVALAPDAIMVSGSISLGQLIKATRTVPIVFALIADPVGAGFVKSLSRPGGNVTGFMAFEYSLSGKWLELLKEITPSVQRVAVLRNPDLVADIGQFAVIQSVAASFGVEPSPIDVRDVSEIEDAVAAFAQSANGGLIVAGDPSTQAHRDLIIALANRYKLPAIYPSRFFAKDGGLVSFGPNFIDEFKSAASYVDRILKGEKPADLPRAGANQVRTGDQPQDREGARPRNSADAARPRRRGHRMTANMKRRAFMTLLGGAAAAWPLAAPAQQADRMRRLGVLRSADVGDPKGKAQLFAFMEELAAFGWADGPSLRMEIRWGGGNVNRASVFAK